MPVCTEPLCPAVLDHSGYCATHTKAKAKARGSRQARGYDARHDRERARWAPKVALGHVRCWRCGQLISPAEQWDLGHDDQDRNVYRGPEHAARCNRAAGGRAAHR